MYWKKQGVSKEAYSHCCPINCGDDVAIEQRSPDEVLDLAGQRIAAAGAEAWNPAFDVTLAGLVDAIVTERGVVCNPDAEKMRVMMG